MNYYVVAEFFKILFNNPIATYNMGEINISWILPANALKLRLMPPINQSNNPSDVIIVNPEIWTTCHMKDIQESDNLPRWYVPTKYTTMVVPNLITCFILVGNTKSLFSKK